MKRINVSINPSYYCNLRCSFCYLTEMQLSDKAKATLDSIEERLLELMGKYEIGHVDIYGGETFLLPPDYLNRLKGMLLSYGLDDINVVTNLTVTNPMIDDPDLYISVSYDYDVREKHELTFNNMLKLTRPFTILMLAGPELIKKDVNEIIMFLNTLTQLENVEIKPYSSNQANRHKVSNREYSEFVKSFICSPIEKHFNFNNEGIIEETLDGQRSSYSDDHIYITPNGKFAVLEFDERGDEYFLELDSVEQYEIWTQVEKKRTESHPVCSTCEYRGKCLSEHLKPVKPVDDDCDGFRELLDWSKTILG